MYFGVLANPCVSVVLTCGFVCREHLFRKAIAAVQYCASVEKGNITEENKAAQ